uniref:Uncharacterized protein n=1 Tax=Oryza nivara TaxID=4536 RepID=A0A0E0GPS3_ORYNI
MAVGMEGQQRLLWWQRRWRGDGVGEANLAAPVAEAMPKESGCRGDGGTGYPGGRSQIAPRSANLYVSLSFQISYAILFLHKLELAGNNVVHELQNQTDQLVYLLSTAPHYSQVPEIYISFLISLNVEYYILRLRPYIAPYWILPSTYARTIIMFSSAMPANRKSHKQFNEYEDLVLNVPIEVSLPNE